jgi:hypothetical protein
MRTPVRGSMGWMGRHVDADKAEWVCRGDSVEDEGRIPSPISNKHILTEEEHLCSDGAIVREASARVGLQKAWKCANKLFKILVIFEGK